MTRYAPLLAALLGAGCATLANGHSGLDFAPSTRSGPFRVLAPGEIGESRAAPFAMDDSKEFFRDPAVLDMDGDPLTLDVAGYFAGNVDAPEGAPPDRIVRTTAFDGRSFSRDPPVVVLQPSLDWEGGTVGAPSVMAHGGGVWLYYAGAGGIGLARGSDGVTFDKELAPVLVQAQASWLLSQPRSPSVIELRDHSFRLFFEADTASGVAVGEARSSDGVTWEITNAPALVAHGGLDAGGVGSPDAVASESEEGRAVLDVYYTAFSADGSQTLGLASRFDDAAHVDAPLERSVSSMLSPNAKLAVREPAVIRFEAFSLLFTTENASKTSSSPAVIVAVAPALALLPPALPP